MGYATVMRVPRVNNYAEAMRIYSNSKPIRGRSDNPRPLGERKNVDTYSVRKNVWTEAIELILYKTPVIKFTVEDEVIINIGNWPSASTCQFISRVVPGISAHRVRGEVVLSFFDGSKVMLPSKGEVALVRGANDRWMPKTKQTLYDYRVNRKEANSVRKQVSQFRDYLAGVVKLKGEEIVGVWGREGFSVVKTNYAELIEVFGQEEALAQGKYRPKVDGWINLSIKPKHYRPEGKDEAWQKYREQNAKFFDLVRNDQDDNARHQNYWIAFNILFIQGQSLYWRDNADYQVALGAGSFNNLLDRILLTMFADTVFKRVALPDGRVPTGKYDNYVLTEED